MEMDFGFRLFEAILLIVHLKPQNTKASLALHLVDYEWSLFRLVRRARRRSRVRFSPPGFCAAFLFLAVFLRVTLDGPREVLHQMELNLKNG